MITDLIYFLLVGICAGWLAGYLTAGRGFGLVGNLIVGIVGAILGGFLFSLLQLSATGLLGRLITSTAGAIVLLTLVQYARRPKRRRRW